MKIRKQIFLVYQVQISNSDADIYFSVSHISKHVCIYSETVFTNSLFDTNAKRVSVFFW